jgi:hypothetical protein
VESFGYLDELEKSVADPVAHYAAVVAGMEAERLRDEGRVSVTKSRARKINARGQNRKNLGYLALSAVYHEIGLDRLMDNRSRKRRFGYSPDKALQLAVFSRVLDPASKLHDVCGQGGYFERFDLSRDDYYGALTFLCSEKDAVLALMDRHMRERYGRGGGLHYFDATNYYFEIDEEDRLRRRGVSKEHRPDPIVQMGLLTDASGFPVTYSLHPGSTHDSDTLIGELARYKRDFSPSRIVCVADKEVNCSENVAALLAKGDGYVFSSTVRGASGEVKRWVTSQEGWRGAEAAGRGEGDAGCRLKSRVAQRQLWLKGADGRRRKGPLVTELQVGMYSPKYDARAKRERERVLEKARAMVRHPGRLKAMFDRSAARYVKGVSYDENGEVLEHGVALSLDEGRLAAEEALDGYYVITTSEAQMAPDDVLRACRGLWEIEESFRVTKSVLSARPVCLTREDRIEAHFLVCFIALLVTRVLEHKVGRAHSAQAVVETLRKASGTHLDANWWIFDHRDEALDDIGAALGLDFTREILSTGDIRRMSGVAKGTSKAIG